MTRWIKNFEEVVATGVPLALGRFPAFVYGRPLGRSEIPVFCYHSATPDSFEAALRFLKDNQYRTLTVHELYEISAGGHAAVPERAVVLTFDDGVRSVWSVIYPLLKKYGYSATVFLIPGRMKSSGMSPSLEDVWNGRISAAGLEAADRAADSLATWQEVADMHASGAIDFQSHTFSHSLIQVSPRIVDFATPETLSRYHPFEFAVAGDREGLPDTALPRLGTPLHAAASRMGEARRWLTDSGLAEACTRFVAENGGEGFFAPGWRRRIDQVVRRYRRAHGVSARYETPAEQYAAMLVDLRRARATIEGHLPGKAAVHLCYPWGVASDLAIAASQEAGYRSGLWGPMRRRVRWDPYRIRRLGEDFFPLLPGRGRSSLRSVLVRKLTRRVKEGSPYFAH